MRKLILATSLLLLCTSIASAQSSGEVANRHFNQISGDLVDFWDSNDGIANGSINRGVPGAPFNDNVA